MTLDTASAPHERAAAPPDGRDVRAQVARVRTQLAWIARGQALLRAVVAGAVAATLVLLLARGVRRNAVAIGSAHDGLIAVLVGAVVAFAAWLVVRARQPAVTTLRAALWLEERAPCAHALVTLVEHAEGALPASVESRLAAQAARTSSASPVWLGAARRRAWRGPALLAAVAVAVFVGGLRWPAVQQSVRETVGGTPGARSVTNARRPSRLADWRIEVTPPAYARRASRTLEDASTVQALPGSRLRVFGRGDTTALSAAWIVRGDAVRPAGIAVRDDADRWVADVMMPARPAALRFADARAGSDRVLTLVPHPDSLPVVQLLQPARDVVQRDSTGSLTLVALARDAYGLGSVRFELIITSGAGERYTARTVVLGERTLDGRARDSVAVSTTLEALGLVPGDVVHLRAVARDRHPAADREAGVSETRSLRIARADEYDSVAVDAAPPPAVDSSILSQRMLLLLTERLAARRPRLARELLVAESRTLAAEQARIRRAVSGIVFQRLSGDGESEHVHYEGDGHDHGLVLQAGKLVPTAPSAGANVMPGATPPPSLASPADAAVGESPVVGINRPLLEAYNHMWDAGRALELADPAAAIPPMRLALEAIQRARAAERVYLRGRTRPIVVDLARVRLAGRDTGQASMRRAGEPLPARDAVWDARLRAAALQLAADPIAGRDSLLALRLDALEARPEVAEALERVLEAVRTGNDVTEALVRARRTIAPPLRRDALPAWGVP